MQDTDQPLIDYMINLLNKDGIEPKERAIRMLRTLKAQGRGFEKPPLKAINHIHRTSATMGVCARCNCDELVFYTENFIDYYCHNCGRRIDWSGIENNYSEFIKRQEEIMNKIIKMLDDTMGG